MLHALRISLNDKLKSQPARPTTRASASDARMDTIGLFHAMLRHKNISKIQAKDKSHKIIMLDFGLSLFYKSVKFSDTITPMEVHPGRRSTGGKTRRSEGLQGGTFSRPRESEADPARFCRRDQASRAGQPTYAASNTHPARPSLGRLRAKCVERGGAGAPLARFVGGGGGQDSTATPGVTGRYFNQLNYHRALLIR